VFLSREDSALFYKLNGALLVYLNRHLGLLPGIESYDAFTHASFEDKVKLRDALYDHPELIDRFIADNPRAFAPDELAEIASWKRFIRGDFYILRFLKRYTVFLDSGSPAKAYGVLGITESIEDMVPRERLPLHVETVLLPFRGRTIYDGVMQTSSIYFGPSIRRSLNETYQAIRESRGIIERLDAQGDQPQQERQGAKSSQAAQVLLASVERIVREVGSLKGAEAGVQRRAQAVLRAAADLLRMAVDDPADWDGLTKSIRRARTAITQLERTLDRQIWGE